jgi:hypothetical protein
MAAYIGAQLDVKNTHWQKAYGPKAGTLVQHYGGKVLAGAGATPERLDSVIATLPPLLDQRIAAGCHLDPQGQGTARHGSASVRTDTQTMPASATNHTRGATPAHAYALVCGVRERHGSSYNGGMERSESRSRT